MIVIRIIIYPLRLLLSKFKRRRDPFEFELDPDRKRPLLERVKETIFGRIYYAYQWVLENVRVRRYNRQNHLKEEGIAFQLAKIGRSMLMYLVLTIILSVAVDWSISSILNSLHLPDIKFLKVPPGTFVEEFFKAGIGAISALLGLIFALYAVAFQTTTEKYSSEVIDFINNELVGNFFFKLLIFTDLFLLYGLIEMNITEIYPWFTFLISLGLISLSLVGILIFKNHYLTILKPKSLFGRLSGDAGAAIDTGTNRRKYTFSSISVIFNVRAKFSNILSVTGSLFEDLKKNKNWEDIVYAPMTLSSILTRYIQKKKFIDKERNWWFFNQYKEVRADNETMLVLKLNYEMQGTGPLNITQPNTEWVEDQIYALFQRFNQEVDGNKEKNAFVLQLIRAYQTILFGDYTKDKNGRYVKTIFGVYENQEFETFDKFLKLFEELFEKLDLSNPEVVTAYTNAYFAISQSVLDGFDTAPFEKELRALIGIDARLAKSRREVRNVELPSLFYAKLNDYYDKLEAEQKIEGKILTPPDLLVAETTKSLKEVEAKKFSERIKILAESQEKIALTLFKKGDYKAVAMLLRLRLDWFSRLVHLKKYDIADEYAYLIAKVAGYVIYIPKEILVESDFFLQIEKIIFFAAMEKKPRLFKELTRFLILILNVMNQDVSKSSEAEQMIFIQRNRILVILGGFVYLVSEFEQDNSLLLDYVQIAERSFAHNIFSHFIKVMAEIKEEGGLRIQLRLIQAETTRYHSWFGMMHWKIDQLPKTYGEVPHYSGLQEVADHPSEFIRKISSDLAFLEDTIIDEFSEWVQKREEIRKLIEVLKKRHEK